MLSQAKSWFEIVFVHHISVAHTSYIMVFRQKINEILEIFMKI